MFKLLKPPFMINDLILPKTDGIWNATQDARMCTTYISKRNGDIHNSFGPAGIIIEFHDAQAVYACYMWYVKGQHHREDGPAIITYHKALDGRVMCYEDFYLFNMFFPTKRQHEDALIKHMLGIDNEALKIIKSLI